MSKLRYEVRVTDGPEWTGEVRLPGHKNRALPHGPKTIGETRTYLRDIMTLLDGSLSPEEFVRQVTARNPDHLNQSLVWFGGLTLLTREA